jgi:hypothetical protein
MISARPNWKEQSPRPTPLSIPNRGGSCPNGYLAQRDRPANHNTSIVTPSRADSYQPHPLQIIRSLT